MSINNLWHHWSKAQPTKIKKGMALWKIEKQIENDFLDRGLTFFQTEAMIDEFQKLKEL